MRGTVSHVFKIIGSLVIFLLLWSMVYGGALRNDEYGVDVRTSPVQKALWQGVVPASDHHLQATQTISADTWNLNTGNDGQYTADFVGRQYNAARSLT